MFWLECPMVFYFLFHFIQWITMTSTTATSYFMFWAGVLLLCFGNINYAIQFYTIIGLRGVFGTRTNWFMPGETLWLVR